MKISTCTESVCGRLPSAEAMRLLAAAGFEFVDYGAPCTAYAPGRGIYAASEAAFRTFFEEESECMDAPDSKPVRRMRRSRPGRRTVRNRNLC